MSRINYLEQEILRHKELYYQGNSQISDKEYDKLEEELRQLDPDNPVLNKVGHSQINNKIKHTTPMLSLEKVYSLEDIIKWKENDKIYMEYKFDGSACSVLYSKGMFYLGKTRGDGEYGEIITQNLQYLKSIPKSVNIKHDIEVRGEVVILKSDYEDLKIEMKKRCLPEPKSIRNIVAGLLHRKEGNHNDLCEYLTFIPYDVYDKDGLKYPITFLRENKFNGMLHPKEINNIKDIERVIEEYRNEKDNLSYLTDGLVFTIENIKDREARGYTSHHPKGRIAFKLKGESTVAKIKNIIYKTGRTGKVAFIGEIEPVELSGAMISKVTLHNAKYIEDHNINIGALIEIERSGEIIPKHIRTVKENGTYNLPKYCSACGHTLQKNNTGIDLICGFNECPSKHFYNIKHWVDVLDMKGLGEKILLNFYISNIIGDIEDLYQLTVNNINHLEGFGEKSAKKIIDTIQATTNISLHKFLTAMGIEGLGKTVSKLLAQEYKTIEKIQKLTEQELVGLEGIGEILSRNIVQGLRNKKEFIENIQKYVTIQEVKEKKMSNEKQFTFVITGKLSKKRSEIQKDIENRGHLTSSAVSKNTDYLVCNEPSSSSKYKKAQKLNVPIITEEELANII